MPYWVYGNNARTGRETDPLFIDAESEAEALSIAADMGMSAERAEFVESQEVTAAPATSSDPEPVPDPANLTSPPTDGSWPTPKNSSAGATWAWVGCALVVLGTSLPWASVGPKGQTAGILDGWRSSASVGTLTVPGGCVAVASVVAASVVTLGGSQWPAGVLALYGLCHTGFMGLALLNTRNMHPQFGLAVSFAGFVLIVIGLLTRRSDLHVR